MISYRAARDSDADAIAELHARSWRATYRGSYTDEYLDGPVYDERRAAWIERLTDPDANQFVVVADDAGRVAGFACAYGAADASLGSFLDNIHTDPERHGQGIGSGLFDAVVAWCRTAHPEHGLHLKVLDRNHNARRFYQRRGGVERGEVQASNPWLVDGTEVLLVVWPTLDAAHRDVILEQQRRYYDERAPDYMVPTRPSDRKGRGGLHADLSADLIDEFAPTGNVLEVACGSGAWTREIVRHAQKVTALDGSPRMIERNQREVASPKANYVVADFFSWEPDQLYDSVVFSFWLSHVPPNDRFDEFWRRVGAALKPGGRVCFVDEDNRAAMLEDLHAVGGVPVARRTLADGRVFDVVKMLWQPAELEQRLTSLGWKVSVRMVGDMWLFGTGVLDA